VTIARCYGYLTIHRDSVTFTIDAFASVADSCPQLCRHSPVDARSGSHLCGTRRFGNRPTRLCAHTVRSCRDAAHQIDRHTDKPQSDPRPRSRAPLFNTQRATRPPQSNSCCRRAGQRRRRAFAFAGIFGNGNGRNRRARRRGLGSGEDPTATISPVLGRPGIAGLMVQLQCSPAPRNARIRTSWRHCHEFAHLPRQTHTRKSPEPRRPECCWPQAGSQTVDIRQEPNGLRGATAFGSSFRGCARGNLFRGGRQPR
jgi:hypothetical protein